MSLKEQTIPVWGNMLNVLDGLMSKAASDDRGNALLDEKLADDMLPLSAQIRMLVNMPGEAMQRLTGLDFASREDAPSSLAQAREWIATAKGQLAEWSSREFIGDDDPVKLVLPNGMEFDLNATQYVRDWALPQYYFHTTTAYSILRAAGLPLGKADFVPHMMQYMTKGPG